jgi:hypothetical protein
MYAAGWLADLSTLLTCVCYKQSVRVGLVCYYQQHYEDNEKNIKAYHDDDDWLGGRLSIEARYYDEAHDEEPNCVQNDTSRYACPGP